MLVDRDEDYIAANLASIQRRVCRAAQRVGRSPNEIAIVGVTKGVPVDMAAAAIRTGIRVLAENRVQDAQLKAPAVLASECDVRWHLIGHLQTNKVRAALRIFDVIQSVDSDRLAQVIERIAAEEAVTVPILIEVNASGEASKHGYEPTNLPVAVDTLLGYPHLQIRGLMTIGPRTEDDTQVRLVFRSLRELRDELALRFSSAGWDTLSMGMSDDFEIAIEEGSTMIRVGRALFKRSG